MILRLEKKKKKKNEKIGKGNIDILAAQALFVMELSPYTVKITYITISFELFSNLTPPQQQKKKKKKKKNLPPNLNKGFIEPPYTHSHLGDLLIT